MHGDVLKRDERQSDGGWQAHGHAHGSSAKRVARSRSACHEVISPATNGRSRVTRSFAERTMVGWLHWPLRWRLEASEATGNLATFAVLRCCS